MAHVIDFGKKKIGSAEGSIYPPEVEEIEEKIEKELETLKKRVLEQGVDGLTEEDMKKIDLLSFKVSLLYEIYDIELDDDA